MLGSNEKNETKCKNNENMYVKRGKIQLNLVITKS